MQLYVKHIDLKGKGFNKECPTGPLHILTDQAMVGILKE